MKNIIITVTALFSFLCCQAQKEGGYAIITGKIENCKVEQLAISKIFGKYQHYINVSADGTFADTIRANYGKYTIYEVGTKNSTEFYCESGNRIHITYDATNHKETVMLSGKGIEASNYLIAEAVNKKELTERGLSGYPINEKLNQKEYREELTKLKNISLGFLEEHKSGLSKGFIALQKRKYDFHYVGGLLNYTIGKFNIQLDDTFYLPEALMKELGTLGFDNIREHEDILECVRLSGFYFGAEAIRLSREKDISHGEAQIITIKKLVKNKEVLNDQLYSAYAGYLGTADNIKAVYDEFMNSDNTEENKKKFTEQYEILFPLSEGQPSPKFVNYENFKGGVTSLDDFKGKYVFIDVWATWCGPCKEEIPHLAKLEKEYHDKDIVFVSISADKQKSKKVWKNVVTKKNMCGVQLISDKDFKSDFIKAFQIQGIPRFILIDKEGKIVKSQAPNPSQYEKIKKLFSKCDL